MAQKTSNGHANGGDGGELRPRLVKQPATQSSDRLSLPSTMSKSGSSISSGYSTPVPEDAPPSAHSISSVRKHAREQTRHRAFYTIDYKPRLSQFDPDSDNMYFQGFFVLFWVSLAIMGITTMLRNIKDTGYPLRVQVWSLFTVDVVQLGLSDFLMVLSTGITFVFHKAVRRSKGFLRWSQGGIVLQSIYQLCWLIFWVDLPFRLAWTWTAQVFLTLHALTLLMKIHSFAFYNGHLSETERRLSSLDSSRGKSLSSLPAAVRYPRFNVETPDKTSDESTGDEAESDPSIYRLRKDLATELTSPLGHVTYPQNLTVRNFVDYLLCPTLCYELEYPRMGKIRWMELLFKTLAVFGCIFLLTLTTEEFIVPVLNESAFRLHIVESASEKSLILAETISLLLFPFIVTFLLVFLVIFEYVLGAFAEITQFADRRFYADWWNSCDWLEFSRLWNIPVHHFLRRHVYFSSLSRFSSSSAMVITFLVSSVAHELVMGCITKKLRGYGFLAMMLQLPIVAIQRSKFVKGRKTFNNVCFWISIILGLSMMCALYVLV